MRPIVMIPKNDPLHQFTLLWAKAVVKYLEDHPEITQHACRGFEKNVPGWQQAKLGECAFVLLFGLDPYKVLHWPTVPDDGSDTPIAGELFEIKTKGARGRNLMWPYKKRYMFESKRFDYLALVERIDEEHFRIVGFVSKRKFRRDRLEAGPDHYLDEGTWYMDQDDLTDIEMVLAWSNPPKTLVEAMGRGRLVEYGYSILVRPGVRLLTAPLRGA